MTTVCRAKVAEGSIWRARPADYTPANKVEEDADVEDDDDDGLEADFAISKE